MSERQAKARNLLRDLLPTLPTNLADAIKTEMQTLLAQIDTIETTIRNDTLPVAERVAALRRLVEIVLRGD